MKKFISPLTKSPWPKGRFGPIKNQDWYRACIKATDLATKLSDAEIVVTSATTVTSALAEEQYYIEAFEALGWQISCLGKGYETLGQLLALKRLAQIRSARLILVVTWTHYLRVRWLCLRHDIRTEVFVAWGWPRPTELVTDFVLAFLYPVFDLLGLEDWFTKKVCCRRRAGKL